MSTTIPTGYVPSNATEGLSADERERASQAQGAAGAQGAAAVQGMTSGPIGSSPFLGSTMGLDGSRNLHQQLQAPNFPNTPPVGSLDLERADRMMGDVEQVMTHLPQGAMGQTVFPTDALKSGDPSQAAQKTMLNIIQSSGQALTNGQILEQFMRLNLKGAESRLEIHGDLLDAASKTQETEQKLQIAKTEEAAKAAEKAAAKQAKAGIFQPIVAAIVAIASALIAVATLGMATGLVAVAVSATIGVMAGAIKGAVNGKGFDSQFMVDMIGYALAAATLGLSGAAQSAFRVISQAATTIAKEGPTKALTAAIKWLGATLLELMRKSPQGAKNLIEQFGKNIMHMVQKTGTKLSDAAKMPIEAIKALALKMVAFIKETLGKPGTQQAILKAEQSGGRGAITAATEAAEQGLQTTAKGQGLRQAFDKISNTLSFKNFASLISEYSTFLLATTSAASEASQVVVEQSVAMAHNDTQKLEATAALIEVLVKAAEKAVKHENELIQYFQESREHVLQSVSKMQNKGTATVTQIANSLA